MFSTSVKDIFIASEHFQENLMNGSIQTFGLPCWIRRILILPHSVFLDQCHHDNSFQTKPTHRSCSSLCTSLELLWFLPMLFGPQESSSYELTTMSFSASRDNLPHLPLLSTPAILTISDSILLSSASPLSHLDTSHLHRQGQTSHHCSISRKTISNSLGPMGPKWRRT
jgi:hypothetical protein